MAQIIEVLDPVTPDPSLVFADRVEVIPAVFDGRPVLRFEFSYQGRPADRSIVLEDAAAGHLPGRVAHAVQVAQAHDGLRL